jgi:hypothetical protein
VAADHPEPEVNVGQPDRKELRVPKPRLRAERARTLLESTDLRVSEIAYPCGFRSISQFNRRFKEITGKTPGEVRANLSLSEPVSAR